MPKLNTTVKSVRIDNDKLATLERMLGERSINSWMNEKIEEMVAGKPKAEGLPYGINQSDLEDLDTMAAFCGGSVGAMIHLLDEGMNDGSLYIEGGRIVGRPLIDLDGFLEACHDAGADPQKVLDKAAKGIGR
jgi:hypothetical protein